MTKSWRKQHTITHKSTPTSYLLSQYLFQHFSLQGNEEKANGVKEGVVVSEGGKRWTCTELTLQQPVYQLPLTCSKAARQQASDSLDT